ncbi:hypothetical protein [Deinococcus multiflagellatus]|uniref:Uncharacterized protein n=1 Tax=Deinococcus multiflagellatus TaxID=1656887 RepID=A0ABW1ZNS6_9DEIO|nr:hypothetical protein [Deinococcus multiflagellatus]MBZ9714938.1 hypothetical protein [Deinococcus multiflagellatus]
MDTPLATHHLLRGLTPGSLPYTQGLRTLLPVITSGEDRDPNALHDWERLRKAHLDLIDPTHRPDHALALLPRALILGFEASAYIAGLAALIIVRLALLFFMPHLAEGVCIGLSMGASMLALVLTQRLYSHRRQQALTRLGIETPVDAPNISGPHL